MNNDEDKYKSRRIRRTKVIPADHKLKALWELMLDKNITQEDIAEIIGVSREQVTRLINEEDMRLSMLYSIAEAYNCELYLKFIPKNENTRTANIERSLELILQRLDNLEKNNSK